MRTVLLTLTVATTMHRTLFKDILHGIDTGSISTSDQCMREVGGLFTDWRMTPGGRYLLPCSRLPTRGAAYPQRAVHPRRRRAASI